MAKMITCKTCGQEIAKSAKQCPNCGAKLKGGKLRIVAGVIVLFIALSVIAGGGSKDEPKKVKSEQESTTQEVTTSEEEDPTTFTIGETADFDGVQITVENALLSNGTDFFKPDDDKVFLGVILSISNDSNDDINISSLVGFEAYCDDYAVNQSFTGTSCPEWDGYDSVDKKVAAGKRMTGVICYEVPTDFNAFELSIAPDFWSSKQVAFTFTRDQCN